MYKYPFTMKNIFTKCVHLLVLVLLPAMLIAQETTDKKGHDPFDPYFYLTIHGGLTQTGTDLNSFTDFDSESFDLPAFGLNFGRQFSPVFGLRLQGIYGPMSGDNGVGRSFEIDAINFNLNATLNFSNLIFKYKDKRVVTIYGFGGVGYSMFQDGKETLNGTVTDYDLNSPVFLFGPGIGFKLGDVVDLNLEYAMHLLALGDDADKLDNFENDQNDAYGYASLGITFKFTGDALKKMKKDYAEVRFNATPDVLIEKGDSVEVTINGYFPEKYFGKDVAMHFQPVLKHDGGETKLKPMTLKGEDVMGDGVLIRYKEGGSFTYTDKFAYEPEMKQSKLIVNPLAYMAKDQIYPTRDEITENATYVQLGKRELADGVIYTSERIYAGDAMPIKAHHMYEKEVIISESAKIFFRVNMYNLNWYLPLNKKESSQEAIDNLWAFVEKGWEIKNVEIDGWASPEGEETFNENLSENRSETAYEFMLKKFKKLSKGNDAMIDYDDPKEQIDFILKHHGPDWSGFMESVQNSDMKDKNVILNVIRSAGTQEKKEQEIRNMIVIYPEIEDEILKPLRRAEMTVNCFEPKRTDENIAELSTTYPDSLKVEELLYAATMTDDKETQLVIYENAIEIYPNNWRAYNNASICNIKKGNYQEASSLLKDAIDLDPNNGKVYNNMGVLALHQDNYGHAEEMFEKAKSLGEDVSYNMGLIAIEKGDYSKALQLMGNKKCDYNVGLAQLISNEYGKAETTLKCTKENVAEAYYLLAIVGAKTENTSMMYEYLTKAIDMHDDYKDQAAGDREFIEYYDEPDFKALVK